MSVIFFNLGQSQVMYAKSLHSCPTLCDPVDCSQPGYSVQRILQVRTLEWVAGPSSMVTKLPIILLILMWFVAYIYNGRKC